MAAAIVGALGGPVLGAAAVALSPDIVFSGVALAAMGLLAWALRTPRSRRPGRRHDEDRARLAARAADRHRMWLIVLVGLMFGTLDVPAPLRLDELGASAAGSARRSSSRPRSRRREPGHRAADRTATGGCCRPSSARRSGCDGAAAVAGDDVGADRRRSRRGAQRRHPVDAVDGDASDGAEPRGRAGLCGRAHQPRLVDRTDAGSAGGARLGEIYGDELPYLLAGALTLFALPPVTAAQAGGVSQDRHSARSAVPCSSRVRHRARPLVDRQASGRASGAFCARERPGGVSAAPTHTPPMAWGIDRHELEAGRDEMRALAAGARLAPRARAARARPPLARRGRAGAPPLPRGGGRPRGELACAATPPVAAVRAACCAKRVRRRRLGPGSSARSPRSTSRRRATPTASRPCATCWATRRARWSRRRSPTTPTRSSSRSWSWHGRGGTATPRRRSAPATASRG